MALLVPNISFDGKPVELQLSCPYVALIDPMALDGFRDELQELEGHTPAEQRALLAAMTPPLRIGIHEIGSFRPGVYRVALRDFASAKGHDDDPGIVDIDSGTMVLADLAHLAALARAFTWDRYDLALQAPPEDDTIFREIEAEVGGQFFALLMGTAGTPFDGDGAFRLRAASPL
jgi:hypothetical protein